MKVDRIDALLGALLATGGWTGLHEVAALLDCSPWSAARQLQAAVQRGFVVRRRRFGPRVARSYRLA